MAGHGHLILSICLLHKLLTLPVIDHHSNPDFVKFLTSWAFNDFSELFLGIFQSSLCLWWYKTTLFVFTIVFNYVAQGSLLDTKLFDFFDVVLSFIQNFPILTVKRYVGHFHEWPVLFYLTCKAMDMSIKFSVVFVNSFYTESIQILEVDPCLS